MNDVGGRHRRVKEKLCTAQFSGGAIYLGFAGTGTIRRVMIADPLPLAVVLHIWLEQPPFRRQLLDHLSR
jgi:hypothetical protein